MADYPYSPELKKPANAGNVDFLDPKVQKSMKMAMKFVSLQARLVRAFPDVSKEKGTYRSYDGAELPYYAVQPKGHQEKLPAIVYLHGGAFMSPVQATMVRLSLLYAKNCGVRVFLPEYRLAPDHSCKTILEDCYTMLQYVHDNADRLRVDTDQILVYGDSAGGALAASLTHMAKDRNGPKIKGQMLIYPVMDDQSSRYESVRLYPDAAWSSHANEQMWKLYFSHGDCGMKKYAVPMAYEDLSGMPPAYIEPQEIDILRDEALAYAEKLKAAGNTVEVNQIPKSYHGFEADIKSPLVQRVLEKRYQVIRSLLQTA